MCDLMLLLGHLIPAFWVLATASVLLTIIPGLSVPQAFK